MKFQLSNPIRDSFRVSSRDVAEKPHKARRGGGIHTVRVNPEVWAVALTLAAGDALRIEVHSADDVTVHNTRRWR